MRKAQQALTLAGMALFATATIGMSATSAFAAPGDHQPSNGGSNSGHDHNGWDNGGRDNGGWDNNGRDNGHDWNNNGHHGDRRWDQRGHDTARLAGVFHSRRACEATGWLGERWGQWDSYDCDRHGNVYLLEVEKHRGDWHRHGRHH